MLKPTWDFITYKQIRSFAKFSGEVPIGSNRTEHGPVNDAGALFTDQETLKRISPQIQALAASDSSAVDYRNNDPTHPCCHAALAVSVSP